jgi:hypothetical protein
MAIQKNLDRPSCHLRSEGGQQGISAHVVLAAKTSAHVLFDDPHSVEGETEHLSHLGTDTEDMLGRVPEGETIVFPESNAPVAFHAIMQGRRSPEDILDDDLGFLKPLRQVTAFIEIRGFAHQVSGGMDLGRSGLEGFLRVEDERELFILNGYLFKGVLRLVFIFGDDTGYFLPGKPDGSTEEGGLSPVERDLGDVSWGEDQPDPGRVFRLSDVNLLDPGVRMRTP